MPNSTTKEKAFIEPVLPTLNSTEEKPTLKDRSLSDSKSTESSDDSLAIDAEGVLAPQILDIPWRYKGLAFSMIILFAAGSSYSEAVLGPLKSTLVKELGINNAKYGAISSATSLINTVLPIIGGIGIDHWGATYAAIISSIFVLLGAVISASGTNTNHFGLIIAGRVLMGFGSTVIETTQSKLFSHWFTGSHLALIYAVDVAFGRIISLVARLTAVPMSRIGGFWGWALWIPTILCAFNLALCIGYWVFERRCPVQYRPLLGKDAGRVEGSARKKVSWNALQRIPRFYWVLCGTQLFQSSAVSVYTSNLADIQKVTRGTSTLAAGYNTSLQSIIPIVLTPFAGFLFDRFGWRMACVSFCACIWITVFALIGLTTVNPIGPIILGSFALSFNAIPFLASVPLILGDNALLGTAFGIWKSFNNAGAVTLEVAAGAIQDKSGSGVNQYNGVIYFIIGIKAVQVFLGVLYDWIDGRWIGHALRLPEIKRVEMMNELSQRGVVLKGWQVSKKYGFVVAAELGGLIISAWVVYLLYSIGT